MAEMDLFEAMYTARAIRRFKPDPVPDEVITKVLDAAIRAPSGSNEQSWEFVVVKDASQRKKIGDVYRKGGNILMALYANRTKPPHMSQETYDKLMASAMYLLDHMADAPVLLLACLKQTPPAGPPPQFPPDAAAGLKNMARMGGSSIYP
ncbi:MAG TPA: nitroreductase family protein, partial [Candidatus Dormibacteraeota bacterium]|nr:nitroreductase family protein [Candidatus Dormibacteraeota bacterium]